MAELGDAVWLVVLDGPEPAFPGSLYSSVPAGVGLVGGWLGGGEAPGVGVEPAGGEVPGVGLSVEPPGEVPLKLGRTPGLVGGVAPGLGVPVVGGGGRRVWDDDTGGDGTPGVSKGAGTAAIGGCSVGVVSGLIAVVAVWFVVLRSMI